MLSTADNHLRLVVLRLTSLFFSIGLLVIQISDRLSVNAAKPEIACKITHRNHTHSLCQTKTSDQI